MQLSYILSGIVILPVVYTHTHTAPRRHLCVEVEAPGTRGSKFTNIKCAEGDCCHSGVVRGEWLELQA